MLWRASEHVSPQDVDRIRGAIRRGETTCIEVCDPWGGIVASRSIPSHGDPYERTAGIEEFLSSCPPTGTIRLG